MIGCLGLIALVASFASGFGENGFGGVRKTGCEGDTLLLECFGDSRIEIRSAVYGRLDPNICPTSTLERTPLCIAPNTNALIRPRCDGKPKCYVEASDAIFTDPCNGKPNYLDIIYICVPSKGGSDVVQTLSNEGYLSNKDKGGASDKDSIKSKGFSITVCEHTDARFSCGEGEVISIVEGNYGRTDSAICPAGPIKTTSCYTINSVHIIKQRCNNTRSCSIPASNSVFGDPCYGTFKYLQVNYQCVKSGHQYNKGDNPVGPTQDQGFNTVVCELGVANLFCGEGEVISLIEANYGRTDAAICPGGPIKTTSCYTRNSKHLIAHRCNNTRSCTVEAVNSVFGDPCVGTYKYLQVNYKCVKSETQSEMEYNSIIPKTYEGFTRIVCEHGLANLKCDEGEVISLLDANYGRTDRYLCSSGPIKTTNCLEPATIHYVAARCNNTRSCSIAASNSVFGDPCAGTYKYLQVNYNCVKSHNIPDSKHDPSEDGVQTDIVCEHDWANPYCSEGQVISLLEANYGRTDVSVCVGGPIMSTSCYSHRALQILSRSCNGTRQCSVKVSNSVFGDPCRGVFKYLTLKYKCVSTTPPKPQDKETVLTTSRPTITEETTTIRKKEPEGTGDEEDSPAEVTEPSADTETLKKRVCQEDWIKLECETGEVIHLEEANYGRTEKRHCDLAEWGRANSTSCYAPDTVHLLSEWCKDVSRCSLPASNSLFGDPCEGTSKYLEVSYKCLKRDTLIPGDAEATTKPESSDKPNLETNPVASAPTVDVLEGIACEDEVLSVECPLGEVVRVRNASYGRSHLSLCSGASSFFPEDCHSSKSLELVINRCDGKRRCRMEAESDTFGDPCPGIVKYLQVIYTCNAATVEDEDNIGGLMKKTACEGDVLDLYCTRGWTLKIQSANYGRTDSQTCLQGPVKSTSCLGEDSTSIASKLCGNKSRCSLEADNEVFGDPCFNTYKYLEVKYSCQDPKELSPESPTDSAIKERGGGAEDRPTESAETACEGDVLNLSCQEGRVLRIRDASYGRSELEPCPGHTGTYPCHASNSTEIAAQVCEGRMSCALKAVNSIFGDPCPGVYKYLKVYYLCSD